MMPDAKEPCGNCTHPFKGHCISGVRHVASRDEARMVLHPRITVCKTRHCLNPLCSCLRFQRSKSNAVSANER